MAWEWVGTATVGLAGIAATYWTGQRGREQAKDLADIKNTHDLALAREQRQQLRQAEAYIELLTFVHDFTANLMLADSETGQYAKSATPPNSAAIVRIRALLAAYGSTSATKLYYKWFDNLRSANDVRAELSEAQRSGDVKVILDARKVFADRTRSLGGAAERLGEQIANELNSHGRPLG